MPREKSEVLLARVCLRLLEEVTKNDRDQDWVDLYNAIKPLAESHIRVRKLGPIRFGKSKEQN